MEPINQQTYNRLLWLDNARAIGLLLILLCHIPPRYGNFHDFIYSFHVPMFFVYSGLYLRIGISTKSVIRTFKNLIIPYACYNLFLIVIYIVIGLYYGNLSYNWIQDNIIGIIMGSSKAECPWQLIAGPSWFIPALFISKTICSYILSKKTTFVLFSTIILSLLYYWLHYSFSWCFWSIDSAILGCIFIIFGYYCRHYFLKIGTLSLYIKASLIVASLSIMILLNINGCSNMFRGEFGNNLFLFIILGIAGTILTSGIASLLTRRTHLANTLVTSAILFICTHTFIMEYVSLAYIKVSGRSWDFVTIDKAIILLFTILIFISLAALLRKISPKLIR